MEAKVGSLLAQMKLLQKDLEKSKSTTKQSEQESSSLREEIKNLHKQLTEKDLAIEKLKLQI